MEIKQKTKIDKTFASLSTALRSYPTRLNPMHSNDIRSAPTLEEQHSNQNQTCCLNVREYLVFWVNRGFGLLCCV